MKNILLLIAFVFFSACGSLPEDSSVAPIDAGVYSVELRSSCGQDVGLHGCSYKPSDDLAQGYLSIPVGFEGEIQVDSERCNFARKFSFKGQQEVKFSWAELTGAKPQGIFACLFSVRVKIEGVRSMLGQFLLTSTEEFNTAEIQFFGKKYVGVASYQLPKGMLLDPEFTFNSSPSGKIAYQGCGAQGEVQGNTIKLSQISPERKDCLIEVFGVDEKLYVGTINLKFYEPTYVELPDPVIGFKNGKLSIQADKIVAMTSINSKWKKGNKLSLKVGTDKTAWVRILTTNGRFKLLGIKNGDIVWTSSKK